MTTRADELAERAAFLAHTFGDRWSGENGQDNYRLFDRAGRMTIGCDTTGTVSIILDGRPALFRHHGPGNRVHLLLESEGTLCKLLGVPAEVSI